MSFKKTVLMGVLFAAMPVSAQAAGTCKVAGMYRDLLADKTMRYEGQQTVADLGACAEEALDARRQLIREDRMMTENWYYDDAELKVRGKVKGGDKKLAQVGFLLVEKSICTVEAIQFVMEEAPYRDREWMWPYGPRDHRFGYGYGEPYGYSYPDKRTRPADRVRMEKVVSERFEFMSAANCMEKARATELAKSGVSEYVRVVYRDSKATIEAKVETR